MTHEEQRMEKCLCILITVYAFSTNSFGIEHCTHKFDIQITDKISFLNKNTF